MQRALRISLRQAVLFAGVMTVVCGGLPFVIAGSANFLGKDVTSIAAGVIGFYPGAAVGEAARVLIVAFGILALGSWPFAAAASDVRRGRYLRIAIFPVLPIFAYALWWAGGLVAYPALYESTLPEWASRLAFQAAFVLSPSMLFGMALLTFAVPPVVSWRRLSVASRPAAQALATPIAILLAVSVWDFPRLDATTSERPNVLILAVDSLRSDRLLRPDVTPNLTSLVRDPAALNFADHYIGIPRTFPSWVEMLEGRYAARTGVRHMFPGFGPRSGEKPGLATVLRDHGYRTSVLSDFAGDIFPRFEAGFHEVLAPKLTLTTMIRMSVDQMFPGLLPITSTGPTRHLFPAMKQSPAFADPTHLGDAVRRRLGRTDGRPWLMTVFFSTAHFPYAAPHPYYTKFAKRDYDGPFRFQKNPEMGLGEGELGAADVDQVRALYDGAVRAVDEEIGRIFSELRRQGLWDSTVVVVTADHGEDLYENGNLQGHGEHLRGENVLKVPFLIKLAGGVEVGPKTFSGTSRSIDVASTIVQACGIDQSVGDGVGLLPWATGLRDSPPQLPAFAETGIWFARGGDGFFQEKRLDYPGISGLIAFDQGQSGEIVLNPVYERAVVAAKHRMLIDGDFKVIYMPTSRGVEYELYNRRQDPQNLQDLAALDPVRLEAMKGKLLTFVSATEERGTMLLDDFVVPP